jgi:Pyruvate/2-oxoacid:ferredoxin oxidoreductase delta subunit
MQTGVQEELPCCQSWWVCAAAASAESAEAAPGDGRRCAAGKLCIEVAPNSKIAWISEELCIGCGICVKVGSALWQRMAATAAAGSTTSSTTSRGGSSRQQ